MTVHQRPRKQQKVFRSLADLSSISGTSGDNTNDAVTTLGASAAEVVTADSNSAHVVVTLRPETVDQTAAGAANVSETTNLNPKEEIMNTIAATTPTATEPAPAAPAAAPAAPAAPAKSALGLTVFAPDFDFSSNGVAANVRLHELGNAAVVLDGRMTEAERRIANLEARGTMKGTMTVSEDQSWEHTGIKIATAAAVGAAMYTGVRLAQMAFGDTSAE